MTKRSLLLGLLMASWVNLWPAYSSLVVDSTRADFSQLSIGLLVPFFILLGLNALLELRSQALSPSELLTICCNGVLLLVGTCSYNKLLQINLATMKKTKVGPKFYLRAADLQGAKLQIAEW